MTKHVLCKDCKYAIKKRVYDRDPLSDSPHVEWWCSHPDLFDPIEGATGGIEAKCDWHRAGWCGIAGSLWQPKTEVAA